ncbi:MAG: alcohol dehydrogenase catalytic domain-containing protein [Acidobacteriota bacterium]
MGSANNKGGASRRGLLKGGLATAAGGILLAPQAAIGQAPAVITGKRFRGWVTLGGNSTLQEMTLRPISGRQVLVRTEAASLCYSTSGAVLGIRPNFAAPAAPAGAPAAAPAKPAAAPPKPPAQQRAQVQGHGGVGIVEAVGPEVRRVKVGDRVCVSGTPHCGACYQCLRGRSDQCQFLNDRNFVPMADMRDGTPVYQNSHIGGLAEYMATYEEWVVPTPTKVAAVELAMVCSCVSVAGLGSTTSPANYVEPGSIVAVVGCGPLGLSAVQGARIAGAVRIIAIDPVAARRQVALKVGATHVLDPNVEGNNLLASVRALSLWPSTDLWAGGRNGGGPDFVIEAVGAETVEPRVERGPDPTGVQAIQQAYQMCAAGGHIVTTSLARGNVTLPAVTFNIGGRTHHAGQAGGCSPMRDIPRFVAMLESGRYDAKSMATRVVPIEGIRDGYEEVAYRTTITGIWTA